MLTNYKQKIMKNLKIYATAFLLLVNVAFVAAQFNFDSTVSCASANSNFSMAVSESPLYQAESYYCYDVTVNLTPNKGEISLSYLFIQSGECIIEAPVGEMTFSQTICYKNDNCATNTNGNTAFIECGVKNPAGNTLCRDGCTVIIEPVPSWP